MSLGYAHVRLTPPDIRGAIEEANAALKLEPEWSYVRFNLMLQLEKMQR